MLTQRQIFASQYINGDIRTMGKQARLQPSVNTILQLDFSLLPAIRNLHSHPNAQIWPRAISALIGGQQDLIYPIVRDIGARIGEGHYDFVNGYVSMQRFYTVFDAPAPQLPRRFSETEFTPATTN
ncbi:hypothetical protein BDR07DRAFT_1499396 [Suillus spraguei]|nr:hypothetical protein BDR07DRAFT_1499396 [Suillus spraguei]